MLVYWQSETEAEKHMLFQPLCSCYHCEIKSTLLIIIVVFSNKTQHKKGKMVIKCDQNLSIDQPQTTHVLYHIYLSQHIEYTYTFNINEGPT